MKAYILGVRARFRGESLIRRLQDAGLDVEIVWGLDASLIPEARLLEMYDDARAKVTCGRSLTAGEIACAWGHSEIARRHERSGEDWALAFEDDAVITDLRLDWLANLQELPTRSVVVLFHDVPGHMYFIESKAAFRRLAVPPRYAAAYALGRDAALESVRHESRHPKIDCTADWPVCWAPKVAFWCLSTPAAMHPGTDSMLEHDRALKSAVLTFPGRGRRIRLLHRMGVEWITALRAILVLPLLRYLIRRVAGDRRDAALRH